ncbi:hypothetical protein LCGC14_0357610 [marine sediment metagenome]|uniref:Uncharacterized protein n=1 Tax=marine sediment metagenome TaxID=412755 RepID=A0A0F9VW01_9ZZZZ
MLVGRLFERGSMARKQCETCGNFEPSINITRAGPLQVSPNYGECRRGEPDAGEDLWPVVRQDDWCGEWEGKK